MPFSFFNAAASQTLILIVDRKIFIMQHKANIFLSIF